MTWWRDCHSYHSDGIHVHCNLDLLDTVRASCVKPRHLDFDDQESSKDQKRHGPLNSNNLRNALIDAQNQLPNKVVTRVAATEEFYLYSDPGYHIMHYRNVMTLYSNDDAWMCKMFPSIMEGPAMRWFLELLSLLIDNFETLVNTFTNTFSVYHDVRKYHKAVFNMKPQCKNEILMNYWKRFRVKLADVKKPDDKLAMMDFKQGIYIHSALSQK